MATTAATYGGAGGGVAGDGGGGTGGVGGASGDGGGMRSDAYALDVQHSSISTLRYLRFSSPNMTSFVRVVPVPLNPASVKVASSEQ